MGVLSSSMGRVRGAAAERFEERRRPRPGLTLTWAAPPRARFDLRMREGPPAASRDGEGRRRPDGEGAPRPRGETEGGALGWARTHRLAARAVTQSSREAEVEAIRDTEQLEFITVSCAIVESLFRRLMNEYTRAICMFLRRSLEDDLSSVIPFISNSLAAIQTTTQSAEEVKRVRNVSTGLNGKMNEVAKMFKIIRDKSTLLMIHDQQSRQSLQFQIDSVSSHWMIFQGSVVDLSIAMGRRKTLALIAEDGLCVPRASLKHLQ
jgi:hypothetical protein